MKRVIACLLALFAPAPTLADVPSSGFSLDASQLAAPHPRAAATATRVAARTPRMPTVLAASTDASKRAETERSYAQLLAAFDQVLDKSRLDHNDVAIAAALNIAIAYGAYHRAEVQDAAFAALVNQVRDALAAAPDFASAPMSSKQDMYEGLAITGMLLAGSMGAKLGDDAIRSLGKTGLESILRTGADSIQLTDRGLRLAGGATRAAAPSESPSPPPPSAAAPSPSVPSEDDAAPTGKPFPSSSIAALLWSFEMRYKAFPENSMVNVESSYLLFTDGSCTESVPSTLVGFDPAKDRAAHPKRTCKWRKDGSSYKVSSGGGFASLPRLTVLRGAKKGEHLSGTWSRSRTGTVGTASTWRGTTLVLGSDGRFELATAGAYQSGTDLNRRDGEVVVSGVHDDEGSRSNISGDRGGATIKTTTGRGPADRSGRYTLDGFSIELHYDSGKTERRMFAISTDNNHVFVRLDGEMMPKK
jgi:hypothetical protein